MTVAQDTPADPAEQTADPVPPATTSTRGRSSSKPAKTAGRTPPARTTRGTSRGRTSTSMTTATGQMPASSGAGASSSLAQALVGLVSSIEAEVASVNDLSSRIDEHVSSLNELRADAARRLEVLDELRAAASDASLSAFLDETIQPQMPLVEEHFPDRIYGS